MFSNNCLLSWLLSWYNSPLQSIGKQTSLQMLNNSRTLTVFVKSTIKVHLTSSCSTRDSLVFLSPWLSSSATISKVKATLHKITWRNPSVTRHPPTWHKFLSYPLTPSHQCAFSSYCSPYISHNADRENLFNDKKLL